MDERGPRDPIHDGVEEIDMHLATLQGWREALEARTGQPLISPDVWRQARESQAGQR